MYVQDHDFDVEIRPNAIGNAAHFVLYQPPIFEFQNVLRTFDNPDDAGYEYSITFSVGISSTTSSSFSVTVEVEAEVSSGIMGASARTSVSSSWSTENSRTYEQAVEETHTLTITKGRWEFRQLSAMYGDLLVASTHYGIYKVLDY